MSLIVNSKPRGNKMPWGTEEKLEQLREEFVRLAKLQNSNISELCRRFGISRKTGYKWLHCVSTLLKTNKKNKKLIFSNKSSRPKHIHKKVNKKMEEAVLAARDLRPFWGAKKLRAYMMRHEIDKKLGEKIPAASTINTILKRHGLITKFVSNQHKPFCHFERTQPNQLWQMDFKGYFSTTEDGYCHPLTILDDHSRFSICLEACRNQVIKTVKPILTKIFLRYGLPDEILLDNGACWRNASPYNWSEITIWMLRLGIHVIHGRFYHPQTQGKDERFHRTLKIELLNHTSFKTLAECQKGFDRWRHDYNNERPHESIGMRPPAELYQVSSRKFPKELPLIKYFDDDIVRTVDFNGYIYASKQKIHMCHALRGLPVALRPSENPDETNVFFCQQIVRKLKLSFERLRQGKKSDNLSQEN